MNRLLVKLACSLLLAIANLSASVHNFEWINFKEGDPASIVKGVSTIHGDYSEISIDTIVSAPDPVKLCRYYSSRDPAEIASSGGWRFNPHCFLFLKKSSRDKKEGVESLHAVVGTPEGSLFAFKGSIDSSSEDSIALQFGSEEDLPGICNTARSSISSWTNQKNNQLRFNPVENSFELSLPNGGKRWYVKHPSQDLYILNNEELPSGNKIFHDTDSQGRLTFIKETNSTEKKILAWIKLSYKENHVVAETSEGKSVDYLFEKDPTGQTWLKEAIYSHAHSATYQYKKSGDNLL